MTTLRKRQYTVFSIACMAFGLLLWARFILVTGHPRTATARPEAAQQAGTSAAPARGVQGAKPAAQGAISPGASAAGAKAKPAQAAPAQVQPESAAPSSGEPGAEPVSPDGR